jgi:hypothetical protein
MGPDVSTLSGQFYIKNIFYIKSNRPEISQIINSTSLKYQASLAAACEAAKAANRARQPLH